MRIILGSALLCAAIGMGTAWAQTSAPSPMSQDQKKTISKSCSDQANAKGLHGEQRRKFRSECKKAGGKSQ
ncbi:MAG: PsiF family protein [Xanthobacteraceae bacterium]